MLRLGEQIGPYILTGKLGRGSFGVVWLAEKRTPLATTRVALKIPLDDEIDMEAIKQEAALWAQASGHPNIIPIIEANIYDDHIVIASEYASDGSIQEWLNRHGGAAPSIDIAVKVMFGILDGLEHLHTRQIIHRDLKPSNLLLQGHTPRIADFGISRIIKTTSQSITIAGTYAYMAPEAFDGRRNEQTDIWAAGVIFYQMLTGRLPFPQKDPASLMAAILTKLPDAMPFEIPGQLQAVIARALDKHPAQRFRSAAEMRAALTFALATKQHLPIQNTVQDRREKTEEQVLKNTSPVLPHHNIQKKTSSQQRHLEMLKVFILVQMFTIIAGFIATIIVVDSIVLSGTVLFLIGLATTIWSILGKLIRGVLLGLSGIAVSLLCAVMIVANNWGPREAQDPVSLVFFFYGILVAIPLGIAAFFGARTLKKRLAVKAAEELQFQR